MSIVREVYKSTWMWVLTGTAVGVSLGGGLSYLQHRARLTEVAAAGGAYCDNGIGAAKDHAGSTLTGVATAAPTPAVTQSAWIPKINDGKPPVSAPAGMIW